MSLLLPLSLALVVASAGEKAELTADQVQYEISRQLLTARGHVVLRTGQWVLRADELTYDQRAGQATARGNVLVVSGTQAVLADEMSVDIGSSRLEAERISLAPCDCDPTSPTWRVEARHADVEFGERAILSWPVVYVHDVPVFAFPWLYLPLFERRSGFLVPRPGFSSSSGLSLDLPVFITLGQSYDVTLTPGYYAGRPSQPALGIRGPRLQAELRYAPAEETLGRATLDLLGDLWELRDPLDATRTLGRPRGLRFAGSLQHTQELGNGFFDRADLSFVSDGYLVRDLVTDVLQREDHYLRSSAAVLHRTADTYADLSVVLRQDIRWGYGLLDGSLPRGPLTFQRLPAARYALPERHLVGPVFGSITLEYSRLAPVLELWGDEGSDGVFDPVLPDPDGSQGNRKIDPGEREARDRLDLRPRLSASFALGNFARVTPYLAWRQDIYVGELTGQVSQRGYPLAGLLLDTELSRRYGPAGNFRHTISPMFELRWIPRIFGTTPAAYDEVDRAVPPGGSLQAAVEIRQRLFLREGARVRELFHLDLGQRLELLGSPRLGDTSGRLGLSLGGLGLDVVGHANLSQGRLTQLSGNVHFEDGRGDGAFLRYDNLVTEGPERLRREIDSLVGPVSPPGQRADLLTAGAHALLFGLELRYEAIAQPQRPDALLVQQSIGLAYGNACDCWRLELHATFRPGSAWPDVGGTLTLARFDSF